MLFLTDHLEISFFYQPFGNHQFSFTDLLGTINFFDRSFENCQFFINFQSIFLKNLKTLTFTSTGISDRVQNIGIFREGS